MKRLLKQKNFLFKLGIVICALWVLVAVLAPVIVPKNPLAQDMMGRFLAPGSAGHLLGTDELGDDDHLVAQLCTADAQSRDHLERK